MRNRTSGQRWRLGVVLAVGALVVLGMAGAQAYRVDADGKIWGPIFHPMEEDTPDMVTDGLGLSQLIFDAKRPTMRLGGVSRSASGLLFYLEDVRDGKVHNDTCWIMATSGVPEPPHAPDLPSYILRVCRDDGEDLYTLPITARYGTAYNGGEFIGESYVVLTMSGRLGTVQTAIFGFKNGVRHAFYQSDKGIVNYSLSPDELRILVHFKEPFADPALDRLFINGEQILPGHVAGATDGSITAKDYFGNMRRNQEFLVEHPQWNLSYAVAGSRWTSDQRFALIPANPRETPAPDAEPVRSGYVLLDVEAPREGQTPDGYAERMDLPEDIHAALQAADSDVQITVVGRELHFWRGELKSEADATTIDRSAEGHLGFIVLTALTR